MDDVWDGTMSLKADPKALMLLFGRIPGPSCRSGTSRRCFTADCLGPVFVLDFTFPSRLRSLTFFGSSAFLVGSR